MQLITYAPYSFKNLKHGEKLCIIDNTQTNELFFPSILENRDGVLYDYINEDLNNYNTYNLKTDKDLLKRFIDDREAKFVNKYCLKLDIDDDLSEFLRFIKEPNVYSYIKDIICNGSIKHLSRLTTFCNNSLLSPIHFNKQCVDRCIKYINDNYNADLNTKKTNIRTTYLEIGGIIISIVLGILGIIF